VEGAGWKGFMDGIVKRSAELVYEVTPEQ
jgi:hypothetical protein